MASFEFYFFVFSDLKKLIFIYTFYINYGNFFFVFKNKYERQKQTKINYLWQGRSLMFFLTKYSFDLILLVFPLCGIFSCYFLKSFLLNFFSCYFGFYIYLSLNKHKQRVFNVYFPSL